MTDAAAKLFGKLTLRYIRRELLDKEFENNVLECKEKHDAACGTTASDDERNFAKALSGFANTAGGVLLFGVRARKRDDVDLIESIAPITGLKVFESRLRELESRVVERSVPGVKYRAIRTSRDAGLLAILIPESPWLPHRSRKDRHFYIRSGGAFTPLDLNLVEDLFFRRQRPKLEFFARRQSVDRVILGLRNVGESSAKSPFLVVGLPAGLSEAGSELDGKSRLTSFVRVQQYLGRPGRFITFVKGHDLVIHPGSEVPLVRLLLSGSRAQVRRLEYYIYAEGMAVQHGTLDYTH